MYVHFQRSSMEINIFLDYLAAVVFFAIFGLTVARPQSHLKTTSDRSSLQQINENYRVNGHELEQNRQAKYEFSSNIEDGINDQTQTRTEMRDGLKVTGSYSYSDGYYLRTVHYEADENGYRIVKEDVLALKDGPEVDLTGTASVNTAAHGTHLIYQVQSVPVPGPVPKVTGQ